MPDFSSQAIILRTVDYSDSDKIVTLFTSVYGKVAVIAKGAKKSIKRFGGTLELFSLVDVVWSLGQRKGLPILKETTVINPFDRIRTDIFKTAYASYWSELINKWMEAGQRHYSSFELLNRALCCLDKDEIDDDVLSIFFQAKFLAFCGFSPNLERCSICQKPLDNFSGKSVGFSLKKGGIICTECLGKNGKISFLRGTLKQLLWMFNAPLDKALRIRFSRESKEEGIRFIETFVTYCFDKEFKSLKFLRDIRN
ncbi:MAG: DNA repair protein RecO [Deltaproteobacteria bacterium]|nr:DNA repair protein RecO [Deltaproteobacteria bacterium]